MEELLTSYLLASAPVTLLVDESVSWNVRPQIETVPAVVLTRISGDRDYNFAGPSGLVQSRIQIDCWAVTHSDAIAVSRAVRTALSGARFSDTGVEVQGTFLDTERHFYEEEEAERFHRVSLDFILWHSE